MCSAVHWCYPIRQGCKQSARREGEATYPAVSIPAEAEALATAAKSTARSSAHIRREAIVAERKVGRGEENSLVKLVLRHACEGALKEGVDAVLVCVYLGKTYPRSTYPWPHIGS